MFNTEVSNIDVPLKYLSNFLKTSELLSLNCESLLLPTWFQSFIIANVAASENVFFAITDMQWHVLVFYSSTKENTKVIPK